MATWKVKVVVENYFDVEADTEAEAEKLAWEYEKRTTDAQVYSIEVEEVEEQEEEEEQREICDACNGAGEDRYEQSCRFCRGRGVL